MNNICFLVGSLAMSGGTYVIFQHATYLSKMGHTVTLAVQEAFTNETIAWHDEGKNLNLISIEEAKIHKYDLVIATWWKTAFELENFDANHYAYFVQSIESRFYSECEKPLRKLVNETYKMPIAYVTEATWIKEHLEEVNGHKCGLVKNGVRKDIYTVNGTAHAPRPTNQMRVLVEGHFGVSFKNTALAVKLAKSAGIKDIWVLTGSPVSWLPGVSKIFSRVPITDVPAIYRSCDLILKLSTVEGMFGPPLEMFHCGGTALVFDVTGHDEYIENDKNAIVLSHKKPESVITALRSLADDREQLEALKHNAIETADNWPSWETSSKEFNYWVKELVQQPKMKRKNINGTAETAYKQYDIDEKDRLSQIMSNRMREKFVRLLRKLPKSTEKWIKEMQAIFEVIFHDKKVR